MDSATLVMEPADGTSVRPNYFSLEEEQGLIRRLEQQIGPCQHGFTAAHQGVTLSTVWQPIISFPHQQVVGVEALMRGKTAQGKMLDTETLFHTETICSNRLALEQLSRLLHLHNFLSLKPFPGWLFLNFSPAIMSLCGDAATFIQMLAKLDIAPSQVVVEVVETCSEDAQALNACIEQLRQAGCLIALDDFGAGHSNLDRVWSLQPDLVKLDQTLVQRSVSCTRSQKVLPRLVELLHQCGAMVVAEGVETVEQALVLWDSGVDMVQGNLFSAPSFELPEQDSISSLLSSLSIQSKRNWQRDTSRRRRVFDHFSHFLRQASMSLGRAGRLEVACRQLLKQAGVRRCFVLDELGCQLEWIETASASQRSSMLFSPVESRSHADWGRSNYFRRAIEHPERVHLSQPYLSIADADLCVTMSICFRSRMGPRVLCCDIDPDFAPDKL